MGYLIPRVIQLLLHDPPYSEVANLTKLWMVIKEVLLDDFDCSPLITSRFNEVLDPLNMIRGNLLSSILALRNQGLYVVLPMVKSFQPLHYSSSPHFEHLGYIVD